jgi:NAD(P)-dependent dehydrogenase (short-subunit alcohol dehydrogenase family)
MARVLVTGSSEGLGLLAARMLQQQGHAVTLHARNAARAAVARAALPECEAVVVGDVSRLAEMRAVAEQANRLGAYDAVIHNVGVGYQERQRVETADGVELVFAVNVLAPYVLTALLPPPRRLVYLSSGMHRGGTPNLDDPQWTKRRWNGSQAYADSKLLDVVLAFAVARRWPGVRSNTVDPGWVPTRMGGAGAPDDLQAGAQTQVWLAVSEDPAAAVSGQHFHHQSARTPHPAARDQALQEQLLAHCASLSGIPLPAGPSLDHVRRPAG